MDQELIVRRNFMCCTKLSRMLILCASAVRYKRRVPSAFPFSYKVMSLFTTIRWVCQSVLSAVYKANEVISDSLIHFRPSPSKICRLAVSVTQERLNDHLGSIRVSLHGFNCVSPLLPFNNAKPCSQSLLWMMPLTQFDESKKPSE